MKLKLIYHLRFIVGFIIICDLLFNWDDILVTANKFFCQLIKSDAQP
jgi:hypothetical protein